MMFGHRHSWEITRIEHVRYVGGINTALYRRCRSKDCGKARRKEISGQWSKEELVGSQHDR